MISHTLPSFWDEYELLVNDIKKAARKAFGLW